MRFIFICILFYFILFYFILFYFILFYFILFIYFSFYLILFYFIFNEMIENLNCQGCPIRQPIEKKKHCPVLYYVFWSILSKMRHVCCRFFQKQLFLNLYALWWNFPCQIYWIGFRMHLASQTIGSHIFF